MKKERDSIDFAKEPVGKLFLKLFVPTLLGLLFSAIFNLADGIFVGRGVGSDALAAVNIAAPVFLVSTGLALLFGTGVSVVAAIHLSHGNRKAANINVTQSFTVSSLLMVILALTLALFPSQVGALFGGSAKLMPDVVDYLLCIAPGLVFINILVIGMFVLRLDGAPKYAMTANIAASLLNIFLDWLFVFPLQMGVKGAAIATSISQCVGALAILLYLFLWSRTIHLYPPKFSSKSVQLTLRNVGYISKIGLPTFLGELAMSCLMIVGNYMFIIRLHEDGVAAFGVTCYLFPLIFMAGNAIVESALPIISYNYGQHNAARVHRTFILSVLLAAGCGLLLTLGGIFFGHFVVEAFLDKSLNAYRIAADGFGYTSLGFLLISVNVVFIGFYQSIERARAATVFMLLRGFIFIIPVFIFLPRLIGDVGLWLAVPSSEFLTLLVILVYRFGQARMDGAKE